jgi:hypothetical protein
MIMHKNWLAARAAMAWALACLLLSASGAAAQTKAAVDPDAEAVRAYRLTMPKVKQMADITAAFAKAMEGDATMVSRKKLDREIEALEAKDSLTDPQQKQLDALREQREAQDAKDDEEPTPKSLAEMAARIDKEPRLAAAIKAGGMSSREFATITLAFYQAMFAHMVQKAGATKELPKEISAENVAFVRDNESALQQIFAKLQAEDKP